MKRKTRSPENVTIDYNNLNMSCLPVPMLRLTSTLPLIVFVLLLNAFFSLAGAAAQDSKPPVFVVPDPPGGTEFALLAQRHMEGLRGHKLQNQRLVLGPRAPATWLMFELRNEDMEPKRYTWDWGGLSEGRWGGVRALTLYSSEIVNAADDPVPGPVRKLNAHGQKRQVFKLAAGEKRVFAFRIVSWPATRFVADPQILTDNGRMSGSRFGWAVKLPWAVGVLGILLLGMALSSTRWGGILSYMGVAVLSMAWALCLHVWDSRVFVEPYWAAVMPFSAVLASLAALSGFGWVRQVALLVALYVIALATGLWAGLTLSGLLPLPPQPYWNGLTGAMPWGFLTLALLISAIWPSVDDTPSGGARFLTLFSALLAAVSGTAYLAMHQLTGSGTEILIYLPAGAVLGTAFVIALAVRLYNIRLETEERKARVHQAKAPEPKETLASAKARENEKKLMKVLEQERALMAELREREAERSEEMRRAKDAADQANQAKSAFLAVVSHEIRTPMTGIMGMVRLLQDTDLTEHQKDYVRTISDSGDAMLALLNDILDFSKIEGGGMELENVDFSLRRLLDGAVALMSGHAAEKGIDLNLRLNSSVPEYLKGDPTRLRQVLLNLVGNAIKFTSEGSVTIDVQSQGEDETGQQICFAVKDTGIGISAQAQKELFSPFAQADKSITRNFGGTGLGLAICKRLIEAMGSAIRVESEPGEGSKFFFTLTLPAGRREDAVNEGQRDTGEAEPMHVLVVDDNAVNRKVIAGLLERDGHSYVMAASGEEALERIQEETLFDAALLDINLDGISGTEVARHIQNLSDPDKAGTPLIALTGNVLPGDQKLYKQAGILEVLSKPIDPVRLHNTLMSVGARQSRGIDAKGEQDEGDQATDGQNPAQSEASKFELEDAELDEDSFSAGADSGGPDMPELNPEETGTDLLDWQTLEALVQSLGAPKIAEMVRELLDKADELIESLHAALAAEDVGAVTARAHELKGMCGNFGVVGLSRQAGEIEKAGRADQLDEARAESRGLTETAAKTRHILENYLGKADQES